MKNYLNSFSVVSFAVSYGFNNWFTNLFVSCLLNLTGSCGVNLRPSAKPICGAQFLGEAQSSTAKY